MRFISTFPFVTFEPEPVPVPKSYVFFTPSKDFFSDQYRSQYTAGLVYQAGADNATLQASVSDWERQGLVTRIQNDRHAVRARLHGKGSV